MAAFDDKADVEHFAKSVDYEAIATKDYNLSVSASVEAKDTREVIDGDHKRQWISNFFNNLIPIPHPDIQAEIVRILDAFTALTTKLIARNKQYSYYRDLLLSFPKAEVEGIVWESP